MRFPEPDHPAKSKKTGNADIFSEKSQFFGKELKHPES